MGYSVKEVFYTLQGEGCYSGRPAVFLRFTGCNLWNGLEADRETAICKFCDTNFVGVDGTNGGKFDDAEALASQVDRVWNEFAEDDTRKMVVCTGGEPLLQLDELAVAALQEKGFYVAVETNGTLLPPEGIDWITVSPKVGASLKLKFGDELKFVYPQEAYSPEKFGGLEFSHFFLQPMDGPEREQNTLLAMEYCLKNPKWKLCLQTQKILNIR